MICSWFNLGTIRILGSIFYTNTCCLECFNNIHTLLLVLKRMWSISFWDVNFMSLCVQFCRIVSKGVLQKQFLTCKMKTKSLTSKGLSARSMGWTKGVWMYDFVETVGAVAIYKPYGQFSSFQLIRTIDVKGHFSAK